MSAGRVAGRGSDVDDGCPLTAASAEGRFGRDGVVPWSLAPHILQKFIPAGFGAPQDGHTDAAAPVGDALGAGAPDVGTAGPGNPGPDPDGLPGGSAMGRRWPHFTQNRDPSRLFSPQLGQRTPGIFR